MSGAQFGTFILGLIAAAIAIAIVVWLLHWLYLRSSKERSFVRTGLGGTKVVLGGGAFVLPIVHDVIPVNMNTLRLEVARGRDKALITKDRMRVDVIAEFYVRVKAEASAVADAAQTLGTRTLAPDQLKELLEGKFVDALRTVAAEMTMEELHEKRGEYVKRVRAGVAGDLLKNGLELEAASLTQLDQTGLEFFNPSNAFDAEGMTRLTEQIERRKKQRNDIEQDTMISIRSKNLEAEKLSLDIDREAEHARLHQERDVEVARAQQRAQLARERAEREQEAESAQIMAREAIEIARILSERSLEEQRIAKEREIQGQEIERRKALELAEQQRAIEVAGQSKAESEARAAADQARARAVTEEERVFTARETEMAERQKKVLLIEASREAEREGLLLRMAAESEKAAAADRGAAVRAQAEAEADADKIRSLALKIRHEIEADGTRLMNEAANVLTPEARASALRLRLVEKMEGIIRESVRPMERIEGIKILQVDGLGGGGRGGDSNGVGLADSVVNSALRFRAQAPLVDQLLREIGVQGGELGAIAQNMSAAALSAPNLAPIARHAAAARTPRDPGLRVERHRRAGRHGVAVGARLQRPAQLGAGRGRLAHREQPALRQDRLHPQLPSQGRRTDPRAAAVAVGLRLPVQLLDPRVADGRTNYVATLKLTPVTDGNRTFAEWSAEFDCEPARERALSDLVGNGVFQAAFDNLKRQLGGAPSDSLSGSMSGRR